MLCSARYIVGLCSLKYINMPEEKSGRGVRESVARKMGVAWRVFYFLFRISVKSSINSLKYK